MHYNLENLFPFVLQCLLAQGISDNEVIYSIRYATNIFVSCIFTQTWDMNMQYATHYSEYVEMKCSSPSLIGKSN